MSKGKSLISHMGHEIFFMLLEITLQALWSNKANYLHCSCTISQELATRKLEASHVLGVSSRPLYNIHMIPLASDKRLVRSLELTWGIIKHDFLSLWVGCNFKWIKILTWKCVAKEYKQQHLKHSSLIFIH